MRFKHLVFAMSATLLPALASFTAAADQCTAPSDSIGFTMPQIDATLYQPDVIKADLDSWFEQSMATHPSFDMAIDIEQLYRVKSDIMDKIDRPMNELEIFRLFSRINSEFNDGHHGIAFAGRNAKIAEAVEKGDRLLPLYIHIDDDYRVFVKKPYQSIKAGAEIAYLNGVKASDMARLLEARSHGDNPRFRRHLVADRFPELIWQHFGSAPEFQLVLKGENGCDTVTVEGTTEVMPHRVNQPAFDPRFEFKLLKDNSVAYMRIDSFYLPEGMDKWNEFTSNAFAQMKEKGAKHLIIDVRRNGGGDDTLWIEGIMPYIAGKPWQRMANFLGRVRDTDEAFPGRVNEVAVFDYQGDYPVSDKRSFEGDVYVMTGPLTYSSAIMFSTVVQDNHVGKIVAQAPVARSCSTGMSNYHEMQVGGVIAFTPIHWYQRNNSTQSCMEGVMPDVVLEDDPYDSMDMVESLIDQISATSIAR